MGKRKRVGFRIGSLVCVIKPSLHVLSVPGYLDDGESWVMLFQFLGSRMNPLDWSLIAAGAVCAVVAFWPEKRARATTPGPHASQPGGPTVRISAEAVPEVASYKEVYEITESQLKGNGIDLIANMLSEYKQECPDDGMFEGEYAIRRFRRWLSEKIANLLLPRP